MSGPHTLLARHLRKYDLVQTSGPVSAYGLVSVARVEADANLLPRSDDADEWVEIALQPLPKGHVWTLLTLADCPVVLAADELIREDEAS